MSACLCERVTLQSPDGGTVDGIMRPNGDCPQHGRSGDIWKAGDPLRRHMKMVDLEYGDRLTWQEAIKIIPLSEPSWRFRRRFREETPREVEERLIAEARGDWSPLMPIAGLA